MQKKKPKHFCFGFRVVQGFNRLPFEIFFSDDAHHGDLSGRYDGSNGHHYISSSNGRIHIHRREMNNIEAAARRRLAVRSSAAWAHKPVLAPHIPAPGG
jgi:hypothetical protein